MSNTDKLIQEIDELKGQIEDELDKFMDHHRVEGYSVSFPVDYREGSTNGVIVGLNLYEVSTRVTMFVTHEAIYTEDDTNHVLRSSTALEQFYKQIEPLLDKLLEKSTLLEKTKKESD